MNEPRSRIDGKPTSDEVDDEDFRLGEARRDVDDDTLVPPTDDLIDDLAHHLVVLAYTKDRCFPFPEEDFRKVEVRLLAACLDDCELSRANLRYIVS